jgi:hypothetical protein
VEGRERYINRKFLWRERERERESERERKGERNERGGQVRFPHSIYNYSKTIALSRYLELRGVTMRAI